MSIVGFYITLSNSWLLVFQARMAVIVQSYLQAHRLPRMPLGDPHGGLFEYTDEGLPETVFACTVPARDPSRSAAFYTDMLGLELLGSDGDRVFLRRGACNIVLVRSEAVGIDTGIYLGVGNPYDTRRRLIDEGVVFAEPPVRTPMGTATAIRDDDGNTLHLIETGAEFRL